MRRALVPTYLSFLGWAQRDDGRFENLLGYDRRFVPGSESEDTLGQAVWGLGTVVACSPDDGWRSMAVHLVDRALPATAELRSTRGRAYAIGGLYGYLERYPGALAVRRVLERLAGRLEASLAEHRGPGWVWFDDELTYANAKMPHAMLLAGRAVDRERWLAAGLETLDFLLDLTFVNGRFDFVGNEGWYPRAGRRAVYGQQPIEAGYTAEACMVAYEVTGDVRYLASARAAVEWFAGRNRQGVALYDPITGRCADGLDRHGVSRNAGAESVLSALLGLLAVPSPGTPPAPRSCGRPPPPPTEPAARGPVAGRDAGARGLAGAAPPLRALGARRLAADRGPRGPGRGRHAVRHGRLGHQRDARGRVRHALRGGPRRRCQGGRVPAHRDRLRAGRRLRHPPQPLRLPAPHLHAPRRPRRW